MRGPKKYPDDEDFVHEEGVLVPAEGGHRVGCDEDDESCAPDEVVEDPVNDFGVPGTPDDLPYDYGVELPPAADNELHLAEFAGADADIGETGAPRDGDGPPPGSAEERELWRKQRALIEEDEKEGIRLDGIPEADVPDLERAIGDDAADTLPNGSDATSATGSVTEE